MTKIVPGKKHDIPRVNHSSILLAVSSVAFLYFSAVIYLWYTGNKFIIYFVPCGESDLSNCSSNVIISLAVSISIALIFGIAGYLIGNRERPTDGDKFIIR